MTSQGRQASGDPTGALLAIDLGGTHIKAACFSPDGNRKSNSQASSNVDESADAIFDALIAASSDLIQGKACAGVGVGVAGVFDPELGVIINSPNIPVLNGFELQKRMQSVFGDIPIRLMNDANAAALGEFHAGAGMGSSSMFLLTLGTGIGGGFVIDGKIWEGTAGVAGEVGHMCIQPEGPPCGCGGRGCLEACVSGWALLRDAKAIAQEKPESAIAAQPHLTPQTLSDLAEDGDKDALALWEKAGTMLGIGIANLMNLLNPECIVLAGGLAKAEELLLEPARRTWEAQAFQRAHETTSVRLGTLGEWAGVRGAIQPFVQR